MATVTDTAMATVTERNTNKQRSKRNNTAPANLGLPGLLLYSDYSAGTQSLSTTKSWIQS